MNNWLEAAYNDLQIHKRCRVGRVYMTEYQLWQSWLKGD